MNHFCGDSEYDKAICGADVLGGGVYTISIVDCIACLKKLIDMGNQAKERLAHCAPTSQDPST